MNNANENQAPQQVTVEQLLFIKTTQFFRAFDELRAAQQQAEQLAVQNEVKAMKDKIEKLETPVEKTSKPEKVKK